MTCKGVKKTLYILELPESRLNIKSDLWQIANHLIIWLQIFEESILSKSIIQLYTFDSSNVTQGSKSGKKQLKTELSNIEAMIGDISSFQQVEELL